MNNLILKLFLATLCFVPVACEEKDDSGISNIVLSQAKDADMLFESKSSSKMFAFKTPSDWRVEFLDAAGMQWCSIEPDSGKGGGNVTTVRVSENAELTDRTVSFKIVSADASQVIKVSQKGQLPSLTLSKTRFDLPEAGGEITVSVTGNVEYSVTMPQVDWLSDISSKASVEGSHTFDVSENPSPETRSAEIVFSNEEMNIVRKLAVVQSGKKTSDSIRILAIGNSFSDDSMWYLYDMLRQAGYSSVKLGNLYIGGCTLQTHAGHIASGAGAYTYRINTDGKWVDNQSFSSVDAVLSDSWDFISMQQASGSSGKPQTYEPYLGTIITKVKELCPDAKLVWNMTWAYQGNSTHSDFAGYDKNQMTMYNAIVDAVDQRVKPYAEIVKIIPAGTAIQNLRTSLYGDTVTRDGYHLAYDSGRLTAALMWVKSLTDCNLDKITYTPSGYIYSEARLAAIRESVENAYSEPFKVTQSEITEDDNDPNASLPALVKAAGFDPDMYEQLDVKVTKVAYYNSSNGNANLGTNMNNYAATQIFQKDQIPNGSLIVIKAGFQYRPEGWTALDKKTSPRPENVAAQVVVVDDAWWREFNYRAFNLSRAGAPNLDDEGQNELATVFGIFVPKS